MKSFLNNGIFLVRLNKKAHAFFKGSRLFVRSNKSITFIIGLMVLVVALVGFFITLEVAAQVAYARLFLDVGLIIALTAVVMAFYKEPALPTDSIIHMINNIKQKKYTSLLSTQESGPLTEIAQAMNELAVFLNDEQKKQEQIKKELREELLPGYCKGETIVPPTHSYHPELGPVVPFSIDPQERIIQETAFKEALTLIPKESALNNPLTDSLPPVAADITNNLDVVHEEKTLEQDLGDLYQSLIDAQEELNINKTEYKTFLETVEEVKNKLKSNYSCKDVLFDVIKRDDEVALQPRLVK